MPVTVNIPTILARLTEGARTVEARGQTVGSVVSDLAERYPGLGPACATTGGSRIPS